MQRPAAWPKPERAQIFPDPAVVRSSLSCCPLSYQSYHSPKKRGLSLFHVLLPTVPVASLEPSTARIGLRQTIKKKNARGAERATLGCSSCGRCHAVLSLLRPRLEEPPPLARPSQRGPAAVSPPGAKGPTLGRLRRLALGLRTAACILPVSFAPCRPAFQLCRLYRSVGGRA